GAERPEGEEVAGTIHRHRGLRLGRRLGRLRTEEGDICGQGVPGAVEQAAVDPGVVVRGEHQGVAAGSADGVEGTGKGEVEPDLVRGRIAGCAPTPGLDNDEEDVGWYRNAAVAPEDGERAVGPEERARVGRQHGVGALVHLEGISPGSPGAEAA